MHRRIGSKCHEARTPDKCIAHPHPKARTCVSADPTTSTNSTKLKPYSPAEFSKIAVQLHLFTSERFHALFTLSSKYFSTFPHGTCSLSDSCKYLALDGVYHPLWAAFTNNPTPRSIQGDTDMPETPPPRAFHPLWAKSIYRTHEWTWSGAASPRNDLNTTLPSNQMATGFGAGLIPVHSPLLRESLLVSFPPLSDMLKFSGYSRLIRGQGNDMPIGTPIGINIVALSSQSYRPGHRHSNRARIILSHDSVAAPAFWLKA